MNASELLINVVIGSEPTVIIGSDQNGEWSVVLFYIGDTSSLAPPAKRQHLNHSVPYTELGKPVSLPYSLELLLKGQGKPTARKAVGGAGKGGWKKRMLRCNGVDTGFERTRRRKSCPLPSGLSSRDDRLKLVSKGEGKPNGPPSSTNQETDYAVRLLYTSRGPFSYPAIGG